ncbi:MAG TPA: SDR family oxidoreductase [Phycisphaerales bacterium]|nr:SDR family oxidoreductase [Phycisphaerales bacterium]
MRVLLTGSTGFIGARVVTALAAAGHTPILTSRAGSPTTTTIDLTDLRTIAPALAATRPDAVIHSAAVRDLAQCEREPDLARLVNLEATRHIARACQSNAITLVFVSTDQVFDGTTGNYSESAPTNPVNVYGETKARAEEAVLASGGRVARVALTLGHSKEGTRSPNEHVVNALRAGQPCTLFTNEYRTPIHVDDVATALVEMLTIATPILHLGGPDRVNRLDLGLAIARAYRLETTLCTPATSNNSSALRRAPDTSLETSLAQKVLSAPPRPLAAAIEALVRTDPAR